jgi:hypothetical protein
VLILFPGLTGGSGDSYVQHAVLQARHAGVRAAVFNSRGTADSPVLTPQFYSASFTEDTREVRLSCFRPRAGSQQHQQLQASAWFDRHLLNCLQVSSHWHGSCCACPGDVVDGLAVWSKCLSVAACLQVISYVRERYPDSTLFAAGWSLGANILVNYLGEQGPDTPLEAAVSMCNPFDLTISNRHINEVRWLCGGGPGRVSQTGPAWLASLTGTVVGPVVGSGLSKFCWVCYIFRG